MSKVSRYCGWRCLSLGLALQKYISHTYGQQLSVFGSARGKPCATVEEPAEDPGYAVGMLSLPLDFILG